MIEASLVLGVWDLVLIHLTVEMGIGFGRLDPPALPDLRLAETTVELESAAVAAEAEPEPERWELARFRLGPAFSSRPSAYSNPAIE